MSDARTFARVTLVASLLILPACAHGGGSTLYGSATGAPGGDNGTNIYPGNFAYVTFLTVGAPAPASFGTSAVPAQLAKPDSPTFDGSGPTHDFPRNVAFPVVSSSMQNNTGAMIAVASDVSATAITRDHPAELHLLIPALGVDATFSAYQNLVYQDLMDAPTSGLSYVVLGDWFKFTERPLNNAPTQIVTDSVTMYMFGYETPASAMPSTGQATFDGRVEGWVLTPVQAEILLWGGASLTAEFASAKVTGAFTGMKSEGISGPYLPWNDVSVNASIATGSSRFSGRTAITSAPDNPLALKGSATGTITGAFYGPNAQNLGAIWTLNDGTASAMGGVTAGRR